MLLKAFDDCISERIAEINEVLFQIQFVKMSYLLTEVAMEMLGWRFYDANGVARQINFEGNSTGVCEDVENLSVSLGCTVVPSNGRIASSVVQAEADSSSHVSTDVINLDDCGGSPVALNNDDIINVSAYDTHDSGNINLLCSSEIPAPNKETPTLENTKINSSGESCNLRIQYVQGGYDAAKAEEASAKTQMKVFNKIQKPQLTNSNVSTVCTDIQMTMNNDANLQNMTSKSQAAVTAFIDLTDSCETESDTIITDTVLEAPSDVLKQPLTFQNILNSHREHDHQNHDVKHLKVLRQETESNYPKYIATCNKLNTPDQLSTSKVQETKRKQPVARKKTSPLNFMNMKRV